MVYTRNKGLPLFRMPDLFNPIFDRILDVIAYAFSLPVPSNVNQDVRGSSDFYFEHESHIAIDTHPSSRSEH